MSRTRSIQTANTESGEYDVKLPLPIPYVVNEQGEVTRQDYWRGQPLTLLGFQPEPDPGDFTGFVHVHQWWAGEAADVVGMFPAFMDEDGSMYALRLPVDSVTEREGVPA